jgi:hypothetical protein
MPVTPERVWRAIRDARQSRPSAAGLIMGSAGSTSTMPRQI